MSDITPSSNIVVSRVGRRVELKMLSHPATLRPVRLALEDFSRAAGLTPRQSDEVGLVLNEALANVMRHQYGGAHDKPIVVTFERREVAPERGGAGASELDVTIRDWGAPFDPARLPWNTVEAKTAAPPDPDQIRPGGLGLLCMKRLMDEVEFIPQPDGMLLKLVKKLGNAKE